MDSVKSPSTMISIVSLTGLVGGGIWVSKQLKSIKDDIDTLNEDVNLLREVELVSKQTKELCISLSSTMQKINQIQIANTVRIQKLDKLFYIIQETLKQNDMELPEDLVRNVFEQRGQPMNESMYVNDYRGTSADRRYNNDYNNTPFAPHYHAPYNQNQGNPNQGYPNPNHGNNYYNRNPREDPIAAEIAKVHEIFNN